MLETARDLRVWLHDILVAICWRIFLCLLLLLYVFSCQLVSVLEDPHTLAKGFIIPKLPRVESAIGKYPLAVSDLALHPISDELRTILCIAVRSSTMLLPGLPLPHIDIPIGISECTFRFFFFCPCFEIAEISACAHGWLLVFCSLFFLLTCLRGVCHLSKAMLLVLLVETSIFVTILLECINAFASPVAFYEDTIVCVAVGIESLAEA